MICTKCNAPNSGSAQYCDRCGAALPLQTQNTEVQHPSPFQQEEQVDSYGRAQYIHSVDPQAESAASTAQICGILGIFLFGFVLGIVAIVQGKKAHRLGYTGRKASAGITLGIIDIILWSFLLLLQILL